MKYCEIMEMADKCMRKALEYRNKNDVDMAVFFRNASEGLRNKALNMVISKEN